MQDIVIRVENLGKHYSIGKRERYKALLASTDAPGRLLLVSIAIVAELLIGGLVYFQRAEGSFADVV